MKNYIVFDLEWNQSPQGKDNSIEELPFEIIEIGAVKLDENFQSISEFHKLVLPKVYQQMHYKISEVTHMNMAQLRLEGEEFREVVAEFMAWCGTEFLFCTWGSMDVTELQRNMHYYQIPNPWALPLFYYDIQKLYALLHGETKMKPSLDTAVEEMGIQETRPFHRALDDAFYTGKIMQTMDFKAVEAYYSMDYYRLPQKREEEVYLKFPTYSKYVSRSFFSKEEALADKMVTDILCCHCGRMLKKTVRWFSFNQRAYFCLASCPEHGFVRGKIRMKKADEGRVYVVKTMKLIDEASAREVYDRKADLKKRRTEKNKLKKVDQKSVSQNS
ncbi:MAG: 3'-5' exonuclease [Hungatella sp.]